MQKKYIPFLFYFFCPFLLTAQQVLVINQVSLQTIENVSIFTAAKNTSVQTSAKGTADISVFKDSIEIFFQHPSSQPKNFTYSQLSAQNFKVSLTAL